MKTINFRKTFQNAVLAIFTFLIVLPQIEAKPKPNKELYEGITKSDLARVKQAIADGADVNKMNSMKYPLEWALSTCHRTDIIKVLLDAGANVNLTYAITGNTILHNYAGIVETPEKKAQWYNDFYKKYKIDTTIDASAYSSIFDVTTLLLDAGADVKALNITQNTPLQTAIEYGVGSETGRAQFIDALLKHKNGPDVNQRLITVDAKSQNNYRFNLKDAEKFPTALMIAAKMNYPEIAQVLIDNKADVNMTVNVYDSKSNFMEGVTVHTKSAVTALTIANAKKNTAIVDMLVKAGAN